MAAADKGRHSLFIGAPEPRGPDRIDAAYSDYGLVVRAGVPGLRYGFNAANRYSISAMSSSASCSSDALGEEGMELRGP